MTPITLTVIVNAAKQSGLTPPDWIASLRSR
jgi:hypothetical protein